MNGKPLLKKMIHLRKKKSCKIQELQIIQKVPKAVYGYMIKHKIEKPDKCLQKWNRILNIDITMTQWLNYFQHIYKTTCSTKYQFFQFRLLHGTLVTKENLFKWGIKDNDLCTFCEEEIEDIKHIFLDCEIIKIFWNKLKSWLKKKLSLVIDFKAEDLLFGSLHEDLLLIDMIFLVAKQYIYSCKHEETYPKMHVFEKKIYNIKNIERDIAIKNNKLQNFLTKWGMVK
jgi:hypothetical protein